MSARVSDVSAAARGRLAERLVPVALALVGAVRDQDGDGIAEFLAGLSAGERDALPVILAAMVPDDRTPQDLLSWVTFDELGRPLPAGAQMVLWSPPGPRRTRKDAHPCGTPGAASRHYANGERPCEACRAAWNADQERRKAGKRQREGQVA